MKPANAEPQICKLPIRVQPGSSRNEVVGWHDNAIKLRITAPPVDGKANACVIEVLSELLKVPRRQITIIQGLTGRSKLVEIRGIHDAEARLRLGL